MVVAAGRGTELRLLEESKMVKSDVWYESDGRIDVVERSNGDKKTRVTGYKRRRRILSGRLCAIVQELHGEKRLPITYD